jgi:hypothetical protein
LKVEIVWKLFRFGYNCTSESILKLIYSIDVILFALCEKHSSIKMCICNKKMDWTGNKEIAVWERSIGAVIFQEIVNLKNEV